MRKRKQSLMLVFLAVNSLPSQAEQVGYKNPVLQDPVILEDLKQFSRQMVGQKPLLGKILNRMGVNYLYELNPKKTYRINEQTLEVSVLGADVSATGIPSTRIDLATDIYEAGDFINGWGTTSIFCLNGGQTAEVSGIMSSTGRSDPSPGSIKDGFLTIDTALFSRARVDFSITKASGGAKNNVTIMQTVHTGSCDGETDMISHTHHYPPLRLSLVIDDTGSMNEELGGVKSALTDFINTHNSQPTNVTRGVSYELISFKDDPTLRLANTDDATVAINAVNTLFASGGGDCPEDSVGALNLALDNLTGDENSIGEIVLVTDASPSSRKIDDVISQAQDLGIKVNVMLSGDCVDPSAASLSTTTATPTTLSASVLSAREVFQRIANETGGLYFYRPGGTVNDYKEILTKIFESSLSTGGNGNSGAPVVTVTATPTVIWPPNHEWVYIDAHASATDDKDPNPVITLVGVTLNEPNDGQGDGNTMADIKITLDGKIYVRAERSGSGNDRFYTITYQATDSEGKIGFGSVDILVPHNQ